MSGSTWSGATAAVQSSGLANVALIAVIQVAIRELQKLLAVQPKAQYPPAPQPGSLGPAVSDGSGMCIGQHERYLNHEAGCDCTAK